MIKTERNLVEIKFGSKSKDSNLESNLKSFTDTHSNYFPYCVDVYSSNFLIRVRVLYIHYLFIHLYSFPAFGGTSRPNHNFQANSFLA